MVFTNQLEAGYFNRDSEYYFAVDAFNENGLTHGTTVTKGEIFVGLPYKGITREIPGTIEAEDFNEGGQGFAYYDTTPGNAFSKYRTGEDVDINEDRRTGAIYLDNTNTGEFTNYTIHVPQSGFYDFNCIGVSTQTGNEGGFYLNFDGDNSATAIQKIPFGNKSAFHTVTQADLFLTEGVHVMTFNIQGHINADKFIFKKGKTGLKNLGQTSINIYPNPSEGIFQARLPQSGYLLVSDIFGRNIYSKHTRDASLFIDISNHPTGIYFLSFLYGNQINKLKIIKK
jgi:hypothetical protein